jgi:hypothetical protein
MIELALRSARLERGNHARCIRERSEAVPAELLSRGYTPSSQIDLVYGQDYRVYAISIWEGLIHYLVLNDETYRPNWEPAMFFDVVDGRLPSTWKYAYWRHLPGSRIDAIWGYEEMASSDPEHYTALIEREPSALRVFEDRRAEIDAEA